MFGSKTAPRALVRKPSSNPAWASLEALGIKYLALPPAPEPLQLDATRERLRKEILQVLVGTWVHMVVDDAAAGEGDAPGRPERRDSALEGVFRAQALKLGRQHGNDMLVAPYGGTTNLGAEAQQGFYEARTERYAKRRETFLTGLLNDWHGNGKHLTLHAFISGAASSFLKDLWREYYGHGVAKTDDSGQLVKQRRASRREHSRVAGATPHNFVQAPDADAGAGDGDSQDWLDAVSTEHAPSPADLMGADELRQELDRAMQTLPEDMRLLFQVELLKHDEGLSDAQLASRLGVSRNTYLARRKQLHDALRKHLGAAPEG